MGCWNETDGITRLPIFPEEKIKVWVIAPSSHQSGGANNVCEIDDLYYPLSLGIDGEYDDYGSVENIESNVCTDALMRAFQSTGITDAETLCKAIEREQLYIRTGKYDESVFVYQANDIGYMGSPETPQDMSLGLFMVKRSTYDNIISFCRQHYKNRDGDNLYSSAITSMREYWKKIHASILKGDHYYELELMPEVLQSIRFFSRAKVLKHVDILINKMAETGDCWSDDIQKFTEEAIDFGLMRYWMQNMRIGWSPTVGRGHQFWGTEPLLKSYSDIYAAEVEKIMRRDEEED